MSWPESLNSVHRMVAVPSCIHRIRLNCAKGDCSSAAAFASKNSGNPFTPDVAPR